MAYAAEYEIVDTLDTIERIDGTVQYVWLMTDGTVVLSDPEEPYTAPAIVGPTMDWDIPF